MSLMVSAQGGGKDFAIHPQEVVAARCTRIIDLGSQLARAGYDGKAPKASRKVMFCFESSALIPEGDFEGQPFVIVQQYTLSIGDKANMRKDLEAWRGRKFTPQELDGFDLKNVLGKACMLNIVHSEPDGSGKVFANIGSIMPLPSGMTAKAAYGELLFFSLNDFSKATFEKLPDWVKKKVVTSPEYIVIQQDSAPPKSGPAAANIDDDDIPF
jgi:hypothetical protein